MIAQHTRQMIEHMRLADTESVEAQRAYANGDFIAYWNVKGQEAAERLKEPGSDKRTDRTEASD